MLCEGLSRTLFSTRGRLLVDRVRKGHNIRFQIRHGKAGALIGASLAKQNRPRYADLVRCRDCADLCAFLSQRADGDGETEDHDGNGDGLRHLYAPCKEWLESIFEARAD